MWKESFKELNSAITWRKDGEKKLLQKSNKICDLENFSKLTERKFQVLEQELSFFKLQEKKAQKKVIEKSHRKKWKDCWIRDQIQRCKRQNTEFRAGTSPIQMSSNWCKNNAWEKHPKDA